MRLWRLAMVRLQPNPLPVWRLLGLWRALAYARRAAFVRGKKVCDGAGYDGYWP
jgi:hypothetical protein